jgi:hypothetical protein
MGVQSAGADGLARTHGGYAPLGPIRKNQTSYRRRIQSAVNSSLSVFIRQVELERIAQTQSFSPSPAAWLPISRSPIKLSPIENSSIRHTTVTKACDYPFAERRGRSFEGR